MPNLRITEFTDCGFKDGSVGGRIGAVTFPSCAPGFHYYSGHGCIHHPPPCQIANLGPLCDLTADEAHNVTQASRCLRWVTTDVWSFHDLEFDSPVGLIDYRLKSNLLPIL